MTDTIRDQAATALAEVEKVTAAIMPEPSTALVTLETAAAPQADAIKERMAQIDMTNTSRSSLSGRARRLNCK